MFTTKNVKSASNIQDNIVISVIILAYNHETTIAKAIESVLEQKTQYSYEILIHDDASTDNTANIIREYEKKYPKLIKAIYQIKNQYSKGVDVFKKYTYPYVQGMYWTILEGDDYWCYERKIEEAITFLNAHKDYVAYCTDTLYHTANKYVSGLKLQNVNLDNFNSDVSFKNLFYLHTSARIYRNIYDFKKEKHKYTYDINIYYTYLDLGKVYCSPKITSVYNDNGQGVWSSLSKQKQHYLSLKALYDNDRRFMYKYHRELVRKIHNFLELENYLGIKLTWFIYLTIMFIKCNIRKV